ncbi:MAG: TMEM175 family protein [Blastococcus sp.]
MSAVEAVEESPLGLERLVFFSDAVFAIVITLLVLPLTAEVRLPEHDLERAVLALWPPVLMFVVSFLVVGQFWIAHHRNFGLIDRQDRTLLWLNLLTLLTVAFMPFPAALLGAHSTAHDAFPFVLYAASMTVTSLALTATWLHAVRRGLVRRSVDRADARDVTRRAFATTAVFAVSVPAAALGLPVALACWLVLLPAVRALVTRRHRR